MCIRLLPKQFVIQLRAYSLPEMNRCSLDKVVLRTFLVDKSITDPLEFFRNAIQPPIKKLVYYTIRDLLKVGALYK